MTDTPEPAAPRSRLRRALRNSWRLVVGVVILIAIFRVVDLRETLAQFSDLDWGQAAMAFGALLLGMVILEAERIWVLFRQFGLTLRQSLSLVLVGHLFINVTGSLVAGEAYRVYQLKQITRYAVTPAALLFMLRFTAALALIPVLLIWVLVEPQWMMALFAQTVGRLDFAALALIAGIGVMGALAAGVLAYRFLKGRRLEGLTHMMESLRAVNPWQWVTCLVIAVIVAVIRSVSTALFVQAQGYSLGLLEPIPVMVLVTLFSLIPISPANLGVREGVFVVGLEALGVPAPVGLAAGLLNRASLMVFGGVGGLTLAWETASRRFKRGQTEEGG